MSGTGTGRQPDVAVRIDGGRWSDIDDLDKLVRAAIAAATAAADGKGEVSVLLTTDDAMRALNSAYRGIDAPTNVLAFPSDAPLLGDIALAFETVAREADEQSKPLRHHVYHLLAHGTLHLLGFDHNTPRERLRMEALEIAILKDFGIPDPYLLNDTEESQSQQP